MAYSAQQKALAVAIINRHDGHVSASALAEIRKIRGLKNVSNKTVSRWLEEAVLVASPSTKNVQNDSDKKGRHSLDIAVIEKAEAALDDIYEEVSRKYLAHALKVDVIADTKGPQAVVAAATATDKMRLLRGLPTEIIDMLPGLMTKITQRGHNPIDVFRRMEEWLDRNDISH